MRIVDGEEIEMKDQVSVEATVSESAEAAGFLRVATLRDLVPDEGMLVHIAGRTIVLVLHQGQVYALDNRCPHMGFPLQKGTIKDGILTCHWHHARFDLACGGTFDIWADDVRGYP